MVDIIEMIGILTRLIFGDITSTTANLFNILKLQLVVYGGIMIVIGILFMSLIAMYILLSETQDHALIRNIIASNALLGLGIISAIWYIAQPSIFPALAIFMIGVATVVNMSLIIISSLDQRFGLMEKFANAMKIIKFGS